MTKPKLYYDRMDSAHEDKARVLGCIKNGDAVLDVGAGSGIITDMILSKYPECRVTVCEIDKDANKRLKEKYEYRGTRVKVLSPEVDFFSIESYIRASFDVVVMSAVLHEIFSYTEYQGERYNLRSVKDAIALGIKLLKRGGALVIRDGILDSHKGRRSLVIKRGTKRGDELARLAERYKNEAGLKLGRIQIAETVDGDIVVKGYNQDIVNLLFTVNWGEGSFERESKEMTAFFTAQEWRNAIGGASWQYGENGQLTIIRYLQDGYKGHLDPYVTFYQNGHIRELPDSNCFIVFKMNK